MYHHGNWIFNDLVETVHGPKTSSRGRNCQGNHFHRHVLRVTMFDQSNPFMNVKQIAQQKRHFLDVVSCKEPAGNRKPLVLCRRYGPSYLSQSRRAISVHYHHVFSERFVFDIRQSDVISRSSI